MDRPRRHLRRVARTIAERDRRSKTKPRHLARRGKAFYSENFAEVDHRNSEFVVLRNSEGNAGRSGCAFEEISACGQFLLLLSRLEIPGIVTIRYREGERQVTAVRDVSFTLEPGGAGHRNN